MQDSRDGRGIVFCELQPAEGVDLFKETRQRRRGSVPWICLACRTLQLVAPQWEIVDEWSDGPPASSHAVRSNWLRHCGSSAAALLRACSKVLERLFAPSICPEQTRKAVSTSCRAHEWNGDVDHRVQVIHCTAVRIFFYTTTGMICVMWSSPEEKCVISLCLLLNCGEVCTCTHSKRSTINLSRTLD